MYKYCSRLMDIKTTLIYMRCSFEVDLFNILCNREGRLSFAMRRFSKVIEDLGLKDLSLQGGPLCWEQCSNNQSKSKLDHFIMFEDWKCHFSGSCAVCSS